MTYAINHLFSLGTKVNTYLGRHTYMSMTFVIWLLIYIKGNQPTALQPRLA